MPDRITRRTVRGLSIAGLVLFVVHCTVALSWSLSRAVIPDVRAVIDVTSETSLWTWLAVLTWVLLGLVCLGWSVFGPRVPWVLTGCLFLFLSIDDACMIHELSGHLTNRFVRESGIYPWLIAIGPVFAVLGIFLFVHLWKTVGRFPRGRPLLLLGFGLMGFAILIEIAEGPVTRSGWTWRGIPGYSYTQAVEELVELFGQLCLLLAIGAPFEMRVREAWSARAG